MRTFICCLTLLWSTAALCTEHTQYSKQQLDRLLTDAQKTQQARDWLRNYFLTPDPLHYTRQAVDQSNDALELEMRLWMLADQLATAPPQAGHQDTLKWLSNYAPQAWIAHPESHGEASQPAFAVKSRAQGALNLWQSQRLQAAYQQAISGQTRFDLVQWQRDHTTHHNLALHAFRGALQALPHKSVQNFWRSHAPDLLPQAPSLAVATALAMNDLDVLSQVVAAVPEAHATQLLQRAMRALPESDRVALLLHAAQHKPTRAFAITLMKPLADRHLRVRDQLRSFLHTAALREAAAFALSGLSDPDALGALAALAMHSDKDTRAAVALSLHLNPSAAAKAQLLRIQGTTPGENRHEH